MKYRTKQIFHRVWAFTCKDRRHVIKSLAYLILTIHTFGHFQAVAYIILLVLSVAEKKWLK